MVKGVKIIRNLASLNCIPDPDSTVFTRGNRHDDGLKTKGISKSVSSLVPKQCELLALFINMFQCLFISLGANYGGKHVVIVGKWTNSNVYNREVHVHRC